MELSGAAERVLEFQSSLPNYQVTFLTPLGDLHRFVETVMFDLKNDRGVLTLESVIFEPNGLLELLGRYSISPTSVPSEYFMHVTITATGSVETAELLEAALGDSVDFVLILSPESFSIYADHDEYITLFANNEAELASLETALVRSGFERKDYVRGF